MKNTCSNSIASLHFITNQWSPLSIEEQVQHYLSAGGRWVQLRLKNLPETEIVAWGKRIQQMCKKHGATFIINDHVHIAQQLDADGVHLGKEDLSPTKARTLLGNGKIIGATANSRADLENALTHPIDYIGLGPFRFTQTKKKLATPMGLEGFQEHYLWMQQQARPLPIIGIGGILPDDVADIRATGIHGIALSSCISHADNPADTTKQLINELKSISTC